MCGRIIGMRNSCCISSLTITRSCTIKTDTVIATVGGIKTTIIAITTLMTILLVIIAVLSLVASCTLLLVLLISLLFLLISGSTNSRTNNSTASHTDYSAYIMSTPPTRDTSNGRP